MKDWISSLLKRIFELLSRLTIGWIFIESGLGKLQNLEKVTAYFESLKIPFASIQAPFVSAVELICGFAVLVGFFTRAAPLPLIGTMVVALITAKSDELTGFSAIAGLSEYLYIVILVGLMAHGSQVLSVDHWRANKRLL